MGTEISIDSQCPTCIRFINEWCADTDPDIDHAGLMSKEPRKDIP